MWSFWKVLKFLTAVAVLTVVFGGVATLLALCLLALGVSEEALPWVGVGTLILLSFLKIFNDDYVQPAYREHLSKKDE